MKKGKSQLGCYYYNKSLDYARLLKNKEMICISLNLLGVAYNSVLENRKALKYFRDALKIGKKLNNKNCYAKALQNLAKIEQDEGKIRSAYGKYEIALGLLENSDDYKAVVSIMNNMGSILLQQGKIDEALQKHRRALDISKENKNRIKEANCLHFIGRIYEAWSNYEVALNFYDDALIIRESIEDLVGKCNTLNNIANIKANTNSTDEALNIHWEIMSIRKKNKDKVGIADTHANIGGILNRQGDHKNALKSIKKARRNFKKKNNITGILATYNGMGTSYLKLEKYRKAEKKYFYALKTARLFDHFHGIGTALGNIAYLYMKKEQYVKAIEYFKDAIYNRDVESSKGISSDIRIKSRHEENLFISCIVTCLNFLGLFRQSLAYIQHSKSRELFVSRKQKIKNSDLERYGLLSKLNEIREKITESRKLEHQAEIGYKNKSISKIQLQDIRERNRTLRKELRKQLLKKQERYWFIYPDSGISLPRYIMKIIENAERNIQDNWIILDFYYNIVNEEILIYFLEKNKNIQLFRKPLKKDSLKRLVRDYPNLVTLRNEEDEESETKLHQLGVEIYDCLISNELREELAKSDTRYLTVIPTRELHILPLEILYDGTSYWGLKYNFSRAFNFESLFDSSLKNEPNLKSKVLLIGNTAKNFFYKDLNPDYPNKNDKLDLPDSAKEIDKIENIIKADFESIKIKEEESILNSVSSITQNNDISIFHYAGHAFFDEKNPELSFLLFHENKKIKKVYSNEIKEIFPLKNNILTILSGCETGGMSIMTGDEIIGMAQGFLSAGSSSLVIAGWFLYDRIAKDFMSTFYYYLIEGFSISEALKLSRKHISSIEVNKESQSDSLNLVSWGAIRFYGNPFLKL